MPQTKEGLARERFLHAGDMVRRLEQSRFAVYYKGHSEEIAVWQRQMQAWSRTKAEALEELRIAKLITPPYTRPVNLRMTAADRAALTRQRQRQFRVQGR
jgi:hypothetical protein